MLETTRRELERDRELAKTSLITASRILHAEIERCSGANGCPRGGLMAWQIARVQAYIASNLHLTIHTRNLSAGGRRSRAHLSPDFQVAFTDAPHAYALTKRVAQGCHLT